MPTPVVPFARLCRAVEAYRAAIEEGYPPPSGRGGGRTATARAGDLCGYGDDKTAARHLATAAALGMALPGWPAPDPEQARALRRRYRDEDADYRAWADTGPILPVVVGKPAEVTKPVLPAANEPVDEWIARRTAEAERRIAAKRAREWMRFQVETPGPFALVFVGDPHGDDNGTDLGLLCRHVALIEQTPAMHAVGLGDWVNTWGGKLAHLYGQQGASEAEAWRFAEWLLSRPIWMLLLMGNHDLWRGAGSPLRWMATHGAPLADWRAQIVVASAEGPEWKIEAAHDFPGRSMWNRAHGPLRRAILTGGAADLYIAGHHHTFMLSEDQDEHTGRTFWAARARGYKVVDAYAEQLGFGTSQDRGHSIVAICDPADGRMLCMSDVERAAEYLTWLRARRGHKPRVRVTAEIA